MATFTYQGSEYVLANADTWSTLDAIKVESLSGRRPRELVRDLMEGGPFGLHAAVWISLRRAGVDVAWNELDLPWVDTVNSIAGDRTVVDPVDPSTASTRQSRAEPAGARRSPARSQKK
jgi:hypothetical protein